ncbi:MAG: Panacea domain-containing protein [Gammaproteobacteria bacterium]
MVVSARSFDVGKAIEAILFVATKLAKPTFHSVSKVFYFADKKHLERYGRFICGDSYVAMKHGPVPSQTCDIMKVPVGRGWVNPDQAELIQSAFDVSDECRIQIKRQPELAQLSGSEIECLDESIAEHGSKSFRELTSLSHDAAWDSADENELISIEEIAKTLPNSEMLIAHLRS